MRLSSFQDVSVSLIDIHFLLLIIPLLSIIYQRVHFFSLSFTPLPTADHVNSRPCNYFSVNHNKTVISVCPVCSTCDHHLFSCFPLDVPDRFPVLLVSRTEYSRGDQLVANCTSPGARPAPKLEWFINGDMVSGAVMGEGWVESGERGIGNEKRVLFIMGTDDAAVIVLFYCRKW